MRLSGSSTAKAMTGGHHPLAGRPRGGHPAQLCNVSSPASHESYFNRYICLQNTQPFQYRPQDTINRAPSITCNTHKRISLLFTFISWSRFSVLVVIVESSLSRIPKSSSEVWYKLLNLFLWYYQYKLSSLSFRVSFTFHVYLSFQVIRLVCRSKFL